MKLSKKEVKNIDYSELVSIAKISTKNDKEPIAVITLLADKPLELKKFEIWLMAFDFSSEREPDIIITYLLKGYNINNSYNFGG